MKTKVADDQLAGTGIQKHVNAAYDAARICATTVTLPKNGGCQTHVKFT